MILQRVSNGITERGIRNADRNDMIWWMEFLLSLKPSLLSLMRLPSQFSILCLALTYTQPPIPSYLRSPSIAPSTSPANLYPLPRSYAYPASYPVLPSIPFYLLSSSTARLSLPCQDHTFSQLTIPDSQPSSSVYLAHSTSLPSRSASFPPPISYPILLFSQPLSLVTRPCQVHSTSQLTIPFNKSLPTVHLSHSSNLHPSSHPLSLIQSQRKNTHHVLF